MNLKEQTVNLETDELTAQIGGTAASITELRSKTSITLGDDDQRRIQKMNQNS